jgi:hypothetical protein
LDHMTAPAELEETRRHLITVTIAGTACALELDGAHLTDNERLLVRSLQEALVMAQRHLTATAPRSADSSTEDRSHLKHQLMLLRAKLKCSAPPTAVSQSAVPSLPNIVPRSLPEDRERERDRERKAQGRNAQSLPSSPSHSPPTSPRWPTRRLHVMGNQVGGSSPHQLHQHNALSSPPASAAHVNTAALNRLFPVHASSAVANGFSGGTGSPSRIPVLARRSGSLPPATRAHGTHLAPTELETALPPNMPPLAAPLLHYATDRDRQFTACSSAVGLDERAGELQPIAQLSHVSDRHFMPQASTERRGTTH